MSTSEVESELSPTVRLLLSLRTYLDEVIAPRAAARYATWTQTCERWPVPSEAQQEIIRSERQLYWYALNEQHGAEEILSAAYGHLVPEGRGRP